jgi:aerotaxis receptor
MRKNLPVTVIEYPITDETLIVSRTDTKGRLTYFNEEFVAAAGFTEAELMGQPHNIIRHPDMPPEAFENLWDTLKAGKPWVGAVKNRRKNGDFYWVLATASPIKENGQTTGYTSVRTKLPADQRAEAEKVYAALREKRAHGYRIDAGIVRRRSLFDHLSLFTGTVKARLITLVAAQIGFMAAVGFLSVLSMHEFTLCGMTVPILVLLGILLSGLLGRTMMRAIGGPLDHLNDTMSNITQGKLDSRIVMERDDEIGEALRNLQTVQTIVRFNNAEVKAVERRGHIRRKEEMSKLADSFQGAVGQIVETVSSASSELEASANTLSSTAVRSQELSTTVAAASEEASTNVQSVASASEDLLLPSTRSAVRSRNRRAYPTRRSTRRAGPTIGSANCRRPLPASATS